MKLSKDTPKNNYSNKTKNKAGENKVNEKAANKKKPIVDAFSPGYYQSLAPLTGYALGDTIFGTVPTYMKYRVLGGQKMNIPKFFIRSNLYLNAAYIGQKVNTDTFGQTCGSIVNAIGLRFVENIMYQQKWSSITPGVMSCVIIRDSIYSLGVTKTVNNQKVTSFVERQQNALKISIISACISYPFDFVATIYMGKPEKKIPFPKLLGSCKQQALSPKSIKGLGWRIAMIHSASIGVEFAGQCMAKLNIKTTE